MLILDDKQLFVRELFCHWRVLSRIAWLLGLLDTAKLMKIFVIAIVQAVFLLRKLCLILYAAIAALLWVQTIAASAML
jgi:hypothetical protein